MVSRNLKAVISILFHHANKNIRNRLLGYSGMFGQELLTVDGLELTLWNFRSRDWATLDISFVIYELYQQRQSCLHTLSLELIMNYLMN